MVCREARRRSQMLEAGSDRTPAGNAVRVAFQCKRANPLRNMDCCLRPILPLDGNRAGPVPSVHDATVRARSRLRSEEHTSELQSLMRIPYAVFCLTNKTTPTASQHDSHTWERE